MIKRGLLATLCALAIGLLTVGAPAGAKPGGDKPRYETEVSIAYDPIRNEYTGTVDSEVAECRQARFVVVKVEDNDLPPKGGIGARGIIDPGNDRPATVGVDRTNKAGLYKVRPGSAPPFFGSFRARVTQDVRHRFICERDVSPVGTFSPLR